MASQTGDSSKQTNKRGASDILVEELAKDATLGLLIRHALATRSILVVFLLLEGIECGHPAGALFDIISNPKCQM